MLSSRPVQVTTVSQHQAASHFWILINPKLPFKPGLVNSKQVVSAMTAVNLPIFKTDY
jgi:hypothetical protein